MNLLHKNNTNALPKAKSTDTHDFGEGSISGNILRLAIPMTLAQLINVLYNIIDRIYIGHLPDVSTQALTGIGLTLPVITIITAFTNLFGMGGAPLFSMARGAGEPARARKILGNSFSMLLISGGILMILCYLSKRPLLYLFGASDITYPYANAYISSLPYRHAFCHDQSWHEQLYQRPGIWNDRNAHRLHRCCPEPDP